MPKETARRGFAPFKAPPFEPDWEVIATALGAPLDDLRRQMISKAVHTFLFDALAYEHAPSAGDLRSYLRGLAAQCESLAELVAEDGSGLRFTVRNWIELIPGAGGGISELPKLEEDLRTVANAAAQLLASLKDDPDPELSVQQAKRQLISRLQDVWESAGHKVTARKDVDKDGSSDFAGSPFGAFALTVYRQIPGQNRWPITPQSLATLVSRTRSGTSRSPRPG